MKSTIAKIIVATAAAARPAGCVSEKKFNKHVASADAAIKAAAQEAAAAKSAADAAGAAASSASSAASSASERCEPGDAGCQGCAGLLRREQREDRSRVPEVDGQVTAQRFTRKFERRRRGNPAAFSFVAAAYRGRCRLSTRGAPSVAKAAQARRSPAGTRARPQPSRPRRCARTTARIDEIRHHGGVAVARVVGPFERCMALDVKRAALPADLGRSGR